MDELIDKIQTEFTYHRPFWPPEIFYTKAVIENMHHLGRYTKTTLQRRTGRTTRMVLDIICDISQDPQYRPLIITHTRRAQRIIKGRLEYYSAQMNVTIDQAQIQFAISGAKELDEVIRRESCGRRVDGIYIDNCLQDMISV